MLMMVEPSLSKLWHRDGLESECGWDADFKLGVDLGCGLPGYDLCLGRFAAADVVRFRGNRGTRSCRGGRLVLGRRGRIWYLQNGQF